MSNGKETLSYSEREKADELAREDYRRRNDELSAILGVANHEPVSAHDVDIAYIEESLERYFRVYNLDLSPDFQRGHVWSREQQICFIESLIKGDVGVSSLIISFNEPSFRREKSPTSDLDRMMCVDGFQRL